MNTDIKIALIAGGISLAVSLLGFISSWIVLRAQYKELERKIQNQFTDKLYSLRLEHYPHAFILTEQIQHRPKPQQIVERTELESIANKLYIWKTGIVSLIISKHALEKFFALRDALSLGYGENDRFTNEQVERIMKARNDFRRSLRQDIGFLYEEDESRDS